MALKDFFKINKTSTVMKAQYGAAVIESLKGEVETNKKKLSIQADIGEPHPFDYDITQGLYKKFGFITGAVDKITDFVWGKGFSVESDNERAKKIIDDWMRDTDFQVIGRQWLKEALVKGIGFLELSGKKEEVPEGIKVLNANNMFIKRDDKGVIKNYNQVIDALTKKDPISFEPHEVAHYSFNLMGDCPYGTGIIYPALNNINNLLQNEKDQQTLTTRKANTPMIAYLGDREKGVIPNQESVDDFADKMTFMNAKTEWALSDDVRVSTVDFGNFGDKFEKVIDHNIDMMFFTFQVPEVMMGRGNIPEGLAKVQVEAFERRAGSIQEEMEKIIEKQIFKRILIANGIDAHVEIVWAEQKEEDKQEKAKIIIETLKNPYLNSALRKELEKELARLLGLDEKAIESDEEEREREEETPQPIVPGQNGPEEKKHCDHNHVTEEDENKDYPLKEWLGFNYKDFLGSIIESINEDPFVLLKGNTIEELAAGKLDETQIIRLKESLKGGFMRGDSIRDMASEIARTVQPKDLLKSENGKIVLDKEGNPIKLRDGAQRSIMIARTESTRMAADGSLKEYSKGGVERVSWVASIGARTCPTCESLNGRIFSLNEATGMIPRHVACRCTFVPVTELD